MYGDDIVLGVSEDSVISFLKEKRNAKLLELIKRDTFPEMEEEPEEDTETTVKAKLETKAPSKSKK